MSTIPEPLASPNSRPVVTEDKRRRRAVMPLPFVGCAAAVVWCFSRPYFDAHFAEYYFFPIGPIERWVALGAAILALLSLVLGVLVGLLAARQQWLRLVIAMLSCVPWATAKALGQPQEVALFVWAMAVPPVLLFDVLLQARRCRSR
jgi:hypothetical protein